MVTEIFCMGMDHRGIHEDDESGRIEAALKRHVDIANPEELIDVENLSPKDQAAITEITKEVKEGVSK